MNKVTVWLLGLPELTGRWTPGPAGEREGLLWGGVGTPLETSAPALVLLLTQLLSPVKACWPELPWEGQATHSSTEALWGWVRLAPPGGVCATEEGLEAQRQTLRAGCRTYVCVCVWQGLEVRAEGPRGQQQANVSAGKLSCWLVWLSLARERVR